MRWLLIVLLVSLCALILASVGLAWHIWRQHAKSRRTPPGVDRSGAAGHEDSDVETEEAP